MGNAPLSALLALALGLLLALQAGCAPGGEAGPGSGESEGAEGMAAGEPTEAPLPRVQVENVLLITVDTLRADALGFAGNRKVETPVLDRLAAAGRVFEDAHAHNVVTLPSHANILTGLYPYQHGVRDNSGFVLASGVPTAATLLRAAGFATAAVVGAFPLDARFGLDRGFDLYDDELPAGSRAGQILPAERRGSEVVERALSWWRARAGERRFLWVHLFEPHAPYEPPPIYAERAPGEAYLGEVAAVDGYLEPLLEPFLAGSEPPTLILFTSDHGEALGEHGELTHGLFAYEPTLKVPLVLWAPGLGPGRDRRSVSHVDLLPTLLAAAGVAAPARLPGRSLFEAAESAPAVYFEALTATLNRGWAPLRGVLRGGHKLISLPLPELYELAADPSESRNLFRSERGRAAELAAAIPRESDWPPRRGEVSEAERRALRSLGYLGGSATARESFGPDDDPKSLVHLDRQMHRVVDLYQRRELEEAARLARQVIDERPDMSVAWYYLAQVELERGRLAEAIAAMSEARGRGAASPALTRQLGMSLAEAGRFGEALEVLQPFAASSDPDGLLALAVVLAEAGRLAEARRALEQVLDLDERNARARETLALVALRERSWERARRQAERALDLDPTLGLAWNYLGTALYNLGRKREALEALRRSVDLDPAGFDALYNLAAVALELGEAATARSALERFLASAPPARYGPDLAQAREWLRQLGS